MKSITITIEDWTPNIRYTNPCGCLLHRAAVREFKPRRADLLVVCPGRLVVDVSKKNPEKYRYDPKWEDQLKLAHADPCYLPLTIPIWKDENDND
jgi:hypothetical protein